MSVNIEVQNGKTDLVKIFVCYGAPSSVVNVEEIEKNGKQVAFARSPIARDLHLLFKSGSDWIQPVQRVKLASMGGVDVVGVELESGQKWTPDLLAQAKAMFARRITPQTGATLPNVERDFRAASDQEVKAVMAATLPSEVYRDNDNPDKAIMPTINRRDERVDFKMGEACAEGACGEMAVQATINRIQHAMDAHYGVPAKRIA